VKPLDCGQIPRMPEAVGSSTRRAGTNNAGYK
jgi:hypothetical protein